CRFYVKGGHMPDIDNLLKSILDSLNGIAWEDDRQIAIVFAERIVGTPERAEIEIGDAGEFCKNMPLAEAEGGLQQLQETAL
ncbi:MAG: RusA family crossover junction endodeoxyribonuclease, partial [Firmicutes bacterium]|nr:RusA family crossover junction endodeoxyribonuclease [Bacillota bacterium]